MNKLLFILVATFLFTAACNSSKKTALNNKVETKAEKIENLSVDEFNVVANSSNIVIIDFNATWCGPCKRLTPMLEQFEKEYGDKVKIVKIDIDKNPLLSQHFRIESIPLLFFYKQGKLVNQIEGLPEKKELKMEIENLVN